MRPTQIILSRSPSSKQWLSRQYSDPYVKQRLSAHAAYRSRSAFKLIEIDALHRFLQKPDVSAVVDLGAAPGGWSQVVAGKLGWSVENSEVVKLKRFSYGERGAKLNEWAGTWSSPKLEVLAKQSEEKGKGKKKRKELAKVVTEEVEEEKFDPLNIDSGEDVALPPGRGTIVAVDLLSMQPVHGVLDIQADFLKPETEDIIHGLLSAKGNFGGRADIVLSDMAANATGNDMRDIESSLEICESVYGFATRHLRTASSIGRKKGGVLLMKYFDHPLLQQFCKENLNPNFTEVVTVKPPSSRSESREAYFLCQGWKG